MSQIYKSTASGPIPPYVPTTFLTDDGSAVPAANILIVNGETSTQDNDNGIIAKGGVIGTGTANEMDLVLTNRIIGSGTAVGATTADLFTFTCAATATVYRFFVDIAGRETTSGLGVTYSLFAGARTDGATATIIETPFDDSDEDGALSTGLADIIASGNTIIVRVTGVVGKTITYKCVATYVAV